MSDRFIETMDQVGNALWEKLTGWMDGAWASALNRGGELLGGLSTSLSEGFRGLKTNISSAIAPNGLGKSSTKAIDSPARSIEPSAPATPSVTPRQDLSAILQSAGFSAESLGGNAIEATDLGADASIGYDGVGCASYQAPRSAAMHTQFAR